MLKIINIKMPDLPIDTPKTFDCLVASVGAKFISSG